MKVFDKEWGNEPFVEELQSERDAWREQAAGDSDAARELRILLRQAQVLPANVGPLESAPTPIRQRAMDRRTTPIHQTGIEGAEQAMVSDRDTEPDINDSTLQRSWLAAAWGRLRGH